MMVNPAIRAAANPPALAERAVGALFDWLERMHYFGAAPALVIDPCAGTGGVLAAVRTRLPAVEMHAADPCRASVEYLERIADRAVLGSYARHGTPGHDDWVITRLPERGECAVALRALGVSSVACMFIGAAGGFERGFDTWLELNKPDYVLAYCEAATTTTALAGCWLVWRHGWNGGKQPIHSRFELLRASNG